MQTKKMILHGIIAAIFYLGIPYAILFALDYFQLLELNMAFIWGLLPFAIVGILFAMLKHAYPKDTVYNRFIMFLITVYSGVYLFYIFGGFTPGVELGNFSLSTDFAEVIVGLKLIAWLLLAGAAFAGVRYLFEAFEIHMKNKSDEPRTRNIKMFRIFKGFGTLTSLVLLGYIFTLIISGVTLRPTLNSLFDYDHDAGLDTIEGTLDDSLNFTISFDMKNGGIYAMQDVNIRLELWTAWSNDTGTLPEGVRVADTINSSFGSFPAFSETYNHTLTVGVDPAYIIGMVTVSCAIDFRFRFNTTYGGIFIDFQMHFIQNWTGP